MKHIRFISATIVSAMATVSLPGAAVAWDGFYGGFTLGYGDGTYLQGSVAGDGVEVDVYGVLGSARLGWNAVNGNNVYGFDVDIGNGPDGVTPQGSSGTTFFCGSGDCSVSINTLATLRGRYGFLTDPDTLIYGAAGLAFGDIEGGIENSGYYGSSNATGFTVGIGIERNLSATMAWFGEVNYYDLGDLEFGTEGFGNTFEGYGDFTTVRVGLNFRF